jgi:glucoamylase
VRFRTRGLRVALTLALIFETPAFAQSQTPDPQGAAATGGPGGAASWTTGNKLAVGTSAGLDSKVWFTVARGITSEVFYPRLDVPNMEDMQYVVTDGSRPSSISNATRRVMRSPCRQKRRSNMPSQIPI